MREVRALLSSSRSLSPDKTAGQWFHSGEKLGRYQVLVPIGRGATAEVYAGRDTLLNRPVALKFIHPDRTPGEALTRRFLREAQAASALNHPNIVTVHEVTESGPSPVIVMELIEGVSLRNRCGAAPVPEAEIRQIGRQIALALAAAHARGLVHRDLKPENIMVRPDGYVKVLDFGLVRQIDTETISSPARDISSTDGRPVGTLRYMAPEQCKGQSATPASDIFALGVILHELASGEHAFDIGAAAFETAHSIVWSEPKALPRNLTTAFRNLVAAMLAKDASARPSAVDVANALAGNASNGQPSPSRRKILAAGGLAIAAAAAAGTAVYRWKKTRPAAAAGVLPFTTEGFAADPVFSPDGSRIAFAWKKPGSKNFHIHLMDADGGNPTPLTNSAGDERDPSWSPDGTQICFMRQGAGESALYTIPAAGGPERRVASIVFSDFPGRAEWLTLDTLVLCDGTRERVTELQRLHIPTGRRDKLTVPPGEARDMTPRRSPDGKWIAFSRAASDTATDIWIAPLQDGGAGEARQITFDQRPKRELRWAPDGKGVIYRMRVGVWGYWYAPVDATPATPPRRVITPDSVSGTFDIRANAKGGWTLALAHYYQTESIWRSEIPGANASPAIPARFISFGFGGIDVNPVLSPDNLHIAFISTRSNAPEIWVVDNAGMSARQLTSLAGPQISIPSWSPDGKWLVASSRFNGDGEMFLVEASGGSPIRVLERRGIEDTEPQFSPDGRWISFASVVGSDHQLFRMPVPASGATKAPPSEQLTRNGGVVHRYSPDGKWIYFVKDSQPGLFRIPAGGGKEELIVDRVRPDLYRGWAIGRQSVYYTALDVASNKPVIYRLNPATGSHDRICAPDKPFPRWTGTLSVSRDESWMIFPQHEAEGARLLRVEDARPA